MAAGKISRLVIAVLWVALTIGGSGCSVTVVAPATDTAGDEGSTTGGGTTTGGDSSTTTNASNPNSPCPDRSNIYVSYVNESMSRITFVENFTDVNQQWVSAKMVVVGPAGDAGAKVEKCIACPWKAGIRNISYIEDGIRAPAPADLSKGQFQCGDHITFTFKADHSISTAVETP